MGREIVQVPKPQAPQDNERLDRIESKLDEILELLKAKPKRRTRKDPTQ